MDFSPCSQGDGRGTRAPRRRGAPIICALRARGHPAPRRRRSVSPGGAVTEGFERSRHRFGEARYFEDLVVGERFYIPSFTAAGASTFAHAVGDALIAFVEQSSKFLKPVYPGDTLYPMLEIAALTPQRSTGVVILTATVHNQKGELVLSGEQKILLRKRASP